jgi:hypothetical protein
MTVNNQANRQHVNLAVLTNIRKFIQWTAIQCVHIEWAKHYTLVQTAIHDHDDNSHN